VWLNELERQPRGPADELDVGPDDDAVDVFR
jgi:hypothetical protein